MKIKLSWIPFIPLVFGVVLLRIYQVLFVESNIDTTLMDANTMTLIYGGGIALLLILVGILSLTDKKTSPVYMVNKNFLGGVFAIVAGAIISFDAVLMFLSCYNGGIVDITKVINAVFSILGAVAFIFMGLVSVTGKNFLKKMPAFMLIPAIWSCARLIITFMSYTTIAVASKDVTDLIYMVFTTLFLFNASMVYIGLQGKNPVKACFIYGMPAIASILAYNGALITKQISSGGTFDVMANLQCFEYLALALFMVFFLLELTSRAKEKEEVQQTAEATVPTVEELEAKQQNDVPKQEPIVTANSDIEFSETVMDSLQDKKEEISSADALANEILGKASADTEYIGYYDRKQKEKEDSLSNTKSYGDRMDDIDKLILEISSNGKTSDR